MGVLSTVWNVLVLLLLLAGSVVLFIGSFSTDKAAGRPLITSTISISGSDIIDLPFVDLIRQEVDLNFGFWGACFTGSGLVATDRTCGSYEQAANTEVARRISDLSSTLQKVNDVAVPALLSVHLLAASLLAVLFLLHILHTLRRRHRLYYILPILISIITILLLVACIVAIAIFYMKVRNAFEDSRIPGGTLTERGVAFWLIAAAFVLGMLGCLGVIGSSVGGCLKGREKRGKAEAYEMEQRRY